MKSQYFFFVIVLSIIGYCSCRYPPKGIKGRVAGYFKDLAGCENQCKTATKNCVGYIYDSRNRGKCITYYYIDDLLPKQNCCPLLVQDFTNHQFDHGSMKFDYDNNTCRNRAVVTCLATSNRQAMIVVNKVNNLMVGLGNVTFPAQCDNDMWTMGSPSLNVTSLICSMSPK